MENEDIAKRLFEVLMEKMWFKEGLPSEGWAIEKICDAFSKIQERKEGKEICSPSVPCYTCVARECCNHDRIRPLTYNPNLGKTTSG